MKKTILALTFNTARLQVVEEDYVYDKEGKQVGVIQGVMRPMRYFRAQDGNIFEYFPDSICGRRGERVLLLKPDWKASGRVTYNMHIGPLAFFHALSSHFKANLIYSLEYGHMVLTINRRGTKQLIYPVLEADGHWAGNSATIKVSKYEYDDEMECVEESMALGSSLNAAQQANKIYQDIKKGAKNG